MPTSPPSSSTWTPTVKSLTLLQKDLSRRSTSHYVTASSLIPSTLQVFNLVSTTSCSNVPLHQLLPQNLPSLARLSTTRRSSFRLHQLLQQLLHRLTTSPNHIQATAFRFTTHVDFITTLHDACRALRSSLNFSNEPPVTTSSSQSLVTVFKLCRTYYTLSTKDFIRRGL